MTRTQKILRLLSTALIAALLSGSVANTLLSAFSMEAAWPLAYLWGALASLLASVMALGALGAVLGGAALLVLCGMAGLGGAFGVRALFSAAREFASVGDWAAFSGHGAAAAMLLGTAFGVLFFALNKNRGGVFFAALIALVTLIGANAVGEDVNILSAVPALIALSAAFAHTSETDRFERGFARALVPATIATLVALLLVPSGRLTWEPLENAANTLRNAFEDYFHFTQERVAFSIQDEGFNHAALMAGVATAKLGGPANPDTAPVMEVRADANMLLRGTIRRDYTGYSWIDTGEKARYLYYDFTRRGTRANIFEADQVGGAPGAFADIAAEIEMLAEGTSTLFVPHRLRDFSMSIENAVYYNSIGEVFLSREVAPGDRYSLTAGIPADENALRTLVGARADVDDRDYYGAMDTALALPDAVEPGVYDLARQLTDGLSNDFDKAAAIRGWLAENCRYELDVGYPPEGRDFVSYFVLDAREGYCSYFASAMAVLARAAGLPSRYVEGYSLRTSPGEAVVLTGEDAHAWVEIYFNGVGWVTFDPTAAAEESDGGSDDGGGDAHSASDEPDGSDDSGLPPDEGDNPTPPPESPESTPTPEADPFVDPTPSPTPDPFAGPESTPDPPDAPDTDPQNPDPPKNNRAWIWIVLAILLILLLIALAYLWVRARLRKTEPAAAAAREKDLDAAGLLIYRALLTLLSKVGQAPLGGEDPSAFARRACNGNLTNPDFEEFARAVALARYAGRGLSAEDIETGLRAYRRFRKKLKPAERLRFDAERILRGLGSTEAIP